MRSIREKTCSVCNSIRTTTTFTTEAYGETFKIQSGPLNFNSKKVLDLLKCKVWGEAPYVGKSKTKFQYMFDYYKSRKYSKNTSETFSQSLLSGWS